MSKWIKSTVAKTRATMSHFLAAAATIRKESGIASQLLSQLTPLTRPEFQLVNRNLSDIRCLVPFMFILVLLPESIPVIILYAPTLIPETCWTRYDLISKTIREQVLARRKRIDALRVSLASSVKSQVSIEEIEEMKEVYQYFQPHTWDRGQMQEYSKYLGLASSRIIPTFFLRRSMNRYFKHIETDDSYLIKGETLTDDQVQDAAWNRGIITNERTDGEIRQRLEKGIALRRKGLGVEGVFFWNVLGNARLQITVPSQVLQNS
jgi:hypothetical protein